MLFPKFTAKKILKSIVKYIVTEASIFIILNFK